jgi:hypothetical protein
MKDCLWSLCLGVFHQRANKSSGTAQRLNHRARGGPQRPPWVIELNVGSLHNESSGATSVDAARRHSTPPPRTLHSERAIHLATANNTVSVTHCIRCVASTVQEVRSSTPLLKVTERGAAHPYPPPPAASVGHRPIPTPTGTPGRGLPAEYGGHAGCAKPSIVPTQHGAATRIPRRSSGAPHRQHRDASRGITRP